MLPAISPSRSRLAAGALAVALLVACSGGGGHGGSAKTGSTTSSSRASSSTGAPSTASASGGTLQASPAPWRLPAPSARAVALSDGKQLFVLGGQDAGKQTIAAVERIDLSTGQAQSAGSLRQAVHDAAGATVGGKMLVLGGGSASETAAIQSFDPSGAAAVAGNLPAPRSDHVAVQANNKVYVLGGYDGSRIVGDVLVSDDGVQYRTLGTLAEPVRYTAAAGVDGALYTFGGVASAQGADTRSIQKIDLASGKVSVVGQLPSTLSHAIAVVLRGQVFVVGGFVNNQPSNQVLRFDPQTNAVVAAGTLPAPVTDGAVATVGDTAYYLGGEGTDRNPVSTVLELKPGG